MGYFSIWFTFTGFVTVMVKIKVNLPDWIHAMVVREWWEGTLLFFLMDMCSFSVFVRFWRDKRRVRKFESSGGLWSSCIPLLLYNTVTVISCSQKFRRALLIKLQTPVHTCTNEIINSQWHGLCRPKQFKISRYHSHYSLCFH